MPRTSNNTAAKIDSEVGARIKMRRKVLGMSQTSLGEKLGVTFQQVQKYEKGMNRVGSSRLQQIAHALGTTPAALFGQVEGDQTTKMVEVQAIEQLVRSSEGFALNVAFVKIRDEQVRRSIIALVKSLATDQGGN
ncbi:helix-turn-helix transcriptional regulator (plasmid) [Rhizobium grahamii]|uniref:Helix-turn-helix transcriptional regulator n=1 Tax=Rhizobium grahamii TaxID=1120045 RepID=A0A5Q0CGN3_9HYPH|nr:MULTISPECIES: helix-turn-helix transcriptional regulator [Rhizobium]QFY63079.1 helix-turn-helix transcriptional regulator [Rhizobium grahamii]QRM52158.1 helix-turn-helix transcriptional regulator [Rhizobium sp. BG6]